MPPLQLVEILCLGLVLSNLPNPLAPAGVASLLHRLEVNSNKTQINRNLGCLATLTQMLTLCLAVPPLQTPIRVARYLEVLPPPIPFSEDLRQDNNLGLERDLYLGAQMLLP